MSTTTSDRKTVTEKRANWEAFEYRVPVYGRVRVENVSWGHESGDHVSVVSVEGGIPFDCSCSDWKFNNPPQGCKHMLAVSNQPAVLEAASVEQ